jgi:hypothetical protein
VLKPLSFFVVGAFTLFGDPTSGPAVGDKLTDAKVKGVLGAGEGKEFNLLDRAKKEPTVIVFVHKLTRPTFRFLKEVDKASGDDKLNAHFVWLSGDVGKTEDYLKLAKNSLSFSTPVGICLDGATGPNGYGLNDQVDVTVLLARDGAVTSNFALVGPNETAAPKIVAAIVELANNAK